MVSTPGDFTGQCKADARSIRFLVACVIVALSTSGCGPLLTAQKFTPPTQVGQKTSGVPFSLNRPKLSIVRTPGAKGAPDTFAITTSYEPDPDQQYTLMINPGLLSNVDWTMTFDTQGTLTDTNAKTTDQTASAITAVASFAGSFALAKSSLQDHALAVPLPSAFKCAQPNPAQPETPVRPDRSLDTIDEDLKSTLSPPEPRLWDTSKSAWQRLSLPESAHFQSVWNQLRDRMLDASCFGQWDEFFYENTEELQLLQTALHIQFTRNPDDSKQIGLVLNKFRHYLDSNGRPKANAPKEVDPSIQEALWLHHELSRIRNTLDTSELDGRKASLLHDRQNLNILAANNIDQDLSSERNVNRIGLCLTLDVIKNWITEPEQLLLQVSAPKPTDWVSQKIAELDKQIAAIQSRDRTPRGNALPSKTGTFDPQVTDLERTKAFIMGVLPEYDKSAFLKKQLTAAGPTSDTKALLAELDYVEKRLSAAQGAVSMPSPQTSPDAPANAIPVVWFSTTASIEQALDGKWPGKYARPDYVVVYSSLNDKVAGKDTKSGDDPAPCQVLQEIPTAPQATVPQPTAMNAIAMNGGD